MEYKQYIFLISVFFALQVFSKNVDLVYEPSENLKTISISDNVDNLSVNEKIIQLEKSVLAIKQNEELKMLNKNIKEDMYQMNEKIKQQFEINASLEAQNKKQNQLIYQLNKQIDDMENILVLIGDKLIVFDEMLNQNNAKLKDFDIELSEKISRLEQKTNVLVDNINGKILSNFKILISAFFLVLIIFVIFGFYVKNKSLSFNGITEFVKKNITENNVALDSKLTEILEKQLNIVSKQNDIDHTLFLKVADEITRMQRSLIRIDASINGLKPLIKGLERIRKNFNAEGYEIVDLLNKPYVDGMNVEVISYIENQKLQPDEKIIVKVIRPQVNYKGKLIQRAQIDVAIN